MEAFVVRVWVPGETEIESERTLTGLHGVVEHVLSKRTRPFRGEADLVAFIRDCLPGLAETLPGQPGTEARDAPSVRGIPGSGPDQASPAPLADISEPPPAAG